MKFAVDSQGAVHQTEKDNLISSVAPIKKRMQFLWQTTNKLMPLFEKSGFALKDIGQDKLFDYYLQPFEAHEYIVCFLKEELSAVSNEVKLSYLMKNAPEKARLMKANVSNGLKTDYTDDMLLSILRDSKNDKQWWLVHALIIKVERNRFDGKIINIELEKPTPYFRFSESFKDNLIEVENGKIKEIEKQKNHFYMYSPQKRDIKNTDDILKWAIEVKELKDKHEKLKAGINKVFEPFKTNLDGYSNARANFINYIICNPIRQVFPVYNQLKEFLKKEFKDIRTIQYNKNRISFYIKEYGRQYIYVCSYSSNDKEQTLFIINGHSYDSLEKLEQALKYHDKSNCFVPVPSFVKNDTDIINYYFSERTDTNGK